MSETPQEELAQGHLFRFTVSCKGVGTVVGDPHIRESNYWSDPWTLEVRGHSLKEALEKAIDLGMGAWDMGEEAEDDD